jgi:hypothetical protein
MYPAYQIRPENLLHEFSCFYRGITDDGQEKVGEILRSLEMAQSSCAERPVSPDLGEKIGEILGSLRVLAPLYGLFQDLQDGMGCGCGENFSTKDPCEVMLAPIKICIDLVNRVYHPPPAPGMLPTN